MSTLVVGAASPARLGVLPVVVGAMVGGLAAARIEAALACGLVAVAGGVLLRVPLPRTRVAWGALTGLALAFVLNLYLNPGSALPWAHVLGRAPTLEGARYGALLVARMVAALSAWWVLMRALPGDTLADEAARLLAPLRRFGLPVDSARLGAGLALRFAPLMRAEAARIRRVQAVRAGGPEHGFAARVRGAQSVWVPLVVCSLERAERTALALHARHYAARVPQGSPAKIPWAGAIAGVALAAWGILWRT